MVAAAVDSVDSVNSVGSVDGRGFALYPLRVGLAVVFLFTGMEKLLDLEGNAVIAAFVGVPWPEATTLAIGVLEVFGALALFLGLMTRTAALLLSLLMVSILLSLKIPGPFWSDGWGIDVAVLSGTLALVVNGAGRPTLWGVLGWGDDPEARVWRRVARVVGAVGRRRDAPDDTV